MKKRSVVGVPPPSFKRSGPPGSLDTFKHDGEQPQAVPISKRTRGMSLVKIQQVVDTYRRKFEEMGIGKIDYPHDEILDSIEHGFEHCHGMLDRMEEFLAQKRKEKVLRWLGFIQGVLWAQRDSTLTHLMNHNRPDPE